MFSMANQFKIKFKKSIITDSDFPELKNIFAIQ